METRVNDILKIKGNKIWSVSPETCLIDALCIMEQNNIGAVLVMDKNNLAGILSERDFARRIYKLKEFNKDTKVAELMTRNVITISPCKSISECMNLMVNNHIRHLPVIENNKVIGVISINDVVHILVNKYEKIIGQFYQ